MNEQTVNIRMIQHYLYCPRRFALLELNRDWAENAYVVQADLMHSHVHEGEHRSGGRTGEKIVRSAVSLYCDDAAHDLYGVADCVEFLRDDENGVEIPNLRGKYRVQLVEYKPKPPKIEPYHEADAIQVFAQKICADAVWGCHSDAYLYYTETRKRVRLPFDTEYAAYDAKLRTLLAEMRSILDAQEIPQRARGQKCAGCSIADLCFPKNTGYHVREEILRAGEADI